MTKLLALDTVFEQCSVAILDNDMVLAETTIAGSRGQTETILPMIDELLKETKLSLADFDVLAFNRGPGAFSGIRINTAVVQALSFAHELPCVGVSSLYALANAFFVHRKTTHNLGENAIIASCIDARQNEVYAGFYQVKNDKLVTISDEKLLAYGSEVVADFVIGNGGEFVQTAGKKITLNPTASDIGKIAYVDYLNNGGVTAKNALPVYLRHNAWKTLAEQGKK
ncbi:tRNA (adenosine(37)-N6)-threonylcarbamoyltransferase complex dimerization subunit type 1 TsaB [Moraxella nasibovis]|uniref:tRNA (adenosine(37)-N6)-threonylcarbamoyltransferase complex dimerization subunit type 1 TsaB n=1 Tax=Moraxella nasibovis TaxID=2904120 RepID=UPI00240EA7BC|nr:tRNA (adenosine(37)-N6)-threonylcarbamoyltransferase complex dimerization subunit type 1 TsaB [Moraxella nasibovis]WFF39412.1 tRNA (adenosine(37)-N6)-threonylcarbamoyltransferase complex dimerization subunit type 1 TsaB [Moraxella nasibovis]